VCCCMGKDTNAMSYRSDQTRCSGANTSDYDRASASSPAPMINPEKIPASRLPFLGQVPQNVWCTT
jgi:hypothetical protein